MHHTHQLQGFVTWDTAVSWLGNNLAHLELMENLVYEIKSEGFQRCSSWVIFYIFKGENNFRAYNQKLGKELRYLSRVHFTEAKVWNVTLRVCQANGTNVIILQTREKNEQYKYKRHRKQPIISNRGRPENSRPCGSSGDDSWFLPPASDPWAGRKK